MHPCGKYGGLLQCVRIKVRSKLAFSDVNGFNNPNYTPTKTNLRRLPLPENFVSTFSPV